MNAAQIHEHIRRKPFQPVRIYLLDGSHHDIKHPEMAIVTRREVLIAFGLGGSGLPDRTVFCVPLHVTRIEPLVEADQD